MPQGPSVMLKSSASTTVLTQHAQGKSCSPSPPHTSSHKEAVSPTLPHTAPVPWAECPNYSPSGRISSLWLNGSQTTQLLKRSVSFLGDDLNKVEYAQNRHLTSTSPPPFLPPSHTSATICLPPLPRSRPRHPS